MRDQPLDSSDYGKLLIFLLFLLISSVFLAGILPAIFLIFGIYMSKRHNDFSYITTANTYCRRYIFFIISIFIISFIGSLFIFFQADTSDYRVVENFIQSFSALIIFIFIGILSLLALNRLFYKILKEHDIWVAQNGILGNKKTDSEVNIIKGEKLTHYSVADELIKWSKLKEDGIVTEEEFNNARNKILK